VTLFFFLCFSADKNFVEKIFLKKDQEKEKFEKERDKKQKQNQNF
jgi:hypothetical protein